MTPKPFVLIPPSEAKTEGGSLAMRMGEFDQALGDARRQVIAALATLVASDSSTGWEKVLQVRGPLLDRALNAMGHLINGNAPLMPAWRRYSGVVWAHLDATNLTPAQRRRLLVPSGLYGVTTGSDLIADYRLKMDVALSPLGGLAHYWRPHVTLALAEYLKGSVVVNLLPKEHGSSIDWLELGENCQIVNVSFLQADGRGAAGHGAKAVKGVVARAIVEEGLAALDGLRWEGWHSRRTKDDILIVAPPVK